MHNRQDRNYTNLSADMSADLKESIDLALAAGVKPVISYWIQVSALLRIIMKTCRQ